MGIVLTMGERISDLIKKSGKSADAIAKEISEKTNVSISKATLSDLSNDIDKGYNYKYILEIAKYFNVSTDYLLGLTEADTNDKELQYICDYTGLNKDAIIKLHNKNFNSDCLYNAIVSIIKENRNVLEKYKNDDNIIDLEKVKFNELNDILTEYINAASDFINSKNFDEILSSYICQKEINKSVITLLDLNKNRISIDELSDDELYCLYVNLAINDVTEHQNLNLFNAQNYALEFIKSLIKYNNDDIMTVKCLSEYVECMWDVRERGEYYE